MKHSVGSGGMRQTVKIFGTANAKTVDGVLTLYDSGTCIWTGTGTVTATMNSSGIVTVTLPGTAYDSFALISAQKISL